MCPTTDFWRMAPQMFEERKAECERLGAPMRVTCFGTSIWDETLYQVRQAAPLRFVFLHMLSAAAPRPAGCASVQG
jgi:hypothetical protein